MTENEIVQMVKGQIKLPGVHVPAVVDALISQAVRKAGPFVWTLWSWSFRRKEDTITMTSDQEYVELPDDFASFRSIRYRNGTTDGWKLKYRNESNYEYYYANPNVFTQDEPTQVKIVKDGESGVWRAYFSPVPDSNYELSLIYNVAFSNISAYDEKFVLLILAAAWLYIYPAGTDQWRSAKYSFDKIMEDMIDADDPNKEEVGNLEVPRYFNVCEGGEIGGNVDDWTNVVDGSDY